ncbi:MAG: S26 family signal peptidase [Eubacteriales bacterium]|nr:S26 family signal peptidase [Eubacteriales bacterium]
MSNSLEELLAAHGVCIMDTEGDSMFPMLRQGVTRISLVPLPEHFAPKKRDLPVYRRPDGKVVCHRIVRVFDPTLVGTRGDNRRGLEKVPVSSFIGIVDGFYRGKRFIPVSSCAYRLYALLWTRLYGLRFPFLWVRDMILRLRLKTHGR